MEAFSLFNVILSAWFHTVFEARSIDCSLSLGILFVLIIPCLEASLSWSTFCLDHPSYFFPLVLLKPRRREREGGQIASSRHRTRRQVPIEGCRGFERSKGQAAAETR